MIDVKTKYNNLVAEYEFMAHLLSHDLRDPIRQALFYSEELKGLNDDQQQKINDIQKSLNYVMEKISLLRAYSHVANSKKEKEEVDLSVVLEESLDKLKLEIDDNSAVITHDKLPKIKGYKSQLVELFYHLISNSIKFRLENEPEVYIKVEDKGDKWQFMVKDNGMGLDNVYRELVFAMFQKINPEENDSYGVGLTFCKKIVENHGGSIWYVSEEGEGAEFYFTLEKI